MKIFRNGLEEASKPGMTPFACSNATLMIGFHPAPEGRWHGDLDEFRVWNVARTGAEIQANLRRELMGNEAHLVAYWRFNEGAGNMISDATGHGHTGFLTNQPTWVASPMPPVPGTALSFNEAGRTNQHLAVPAGIWFNREFTVEAWVYQRSYQFSSCLLDFGNGEPGDNVVAFLSFEVTGMPVLAGYNGPPGTTIQRSSVWSRKKIPLHTWTHVAFTRDTNGLGHIYLDGAHVAARAMYAPRAVRRTNNFIGRSNWSIRTGPDAILDDIRLWNVARNAEEIRREMECPLTGAESNLVAYWRLDDGAGGTATDLTGHGHTATLMNNPQWVAGAAPVSQFPVAHTLGFGELSSRQVTAHGAVCPNGFPTIAWFEWGTHSRHEYTTTPVPLRSSPNGMTFSAVLGGLVPNTGYQFRMVCSNVMGQAEGEDIQLHTPPLLFLGWNLPRWRFAGALALVVAIAVGATVRHYYLRSFRLKLEKLHQQHALEQERTRIARDLHDDLGAAITQLKLLGELVERDAAQPEQTARHARKILRASRDLAQQMDELVWVVNPRKDHLENLALYVSAFCEELFGMTDIRCRLDFPDELPEIALSGHVRHRLFLAFKEALTNVIRHARATEVHVRLELRPSALVLSVQDNGNGFASQPSALNPQPVHGGNGVGNMQARLAEVEGTCTITSQPGAGTCVELRVKLEPAP